MLRVGRRLYGLTSSHRLGLVLSVVVGLVFGRRDVPDRGVQALVVEPVDPLGGGYLDVGQACLRLTELDQLGLVQADLRFHQPVVERVADGADGCVDARLQQVGGEGEGGVLAAGATVTDRMRLRMNKTDNSQTGPDRSDSLPENVADMELHRQLGGA